jgi:DnaJ-class molecular chaperone
MHHVSADSTLALIKLVTESGCLYFQVLSIDYNAIAQEIHEKYWKILCLVLPDRPRQPAAQVVTQLVHKAYHTLMNEKIRKFHMSTLARKCELCAENGRLSSYP